MDRWLLRGARLVVSMGLVGCAARPEVNGSALVVNMQPGPPAFVGAYDFDLLGPVHGTACVTRSSDGVEASTYWLRGAGLEKLAPDGLTARAVGAAAFDAIKSTADADTLVVTRVLSEGHGPDKVCATVFGRLVRLTKAGARSAGSEAAGRDSDDLLER